MTGLSRSTAPLRTLLESRLVMRRRELRSSHSSGEVTPACPISQYSSSQVTKQLPTGPYSTNPKVSIMESNNCKS